MHQFKFPVLHLFPRRISHGCTILLLVKSSLTRVYDHEFDHFNISPCEFLTFVHEARLFQSSSASRYEAKINNSSTESRSSSLSRKKKLSRPINSANVLSPRELFYRLKLNSFPSSLPPFDTSLYRFVADGFQLMKFLPLMKFPNVSHPDSNSCSFLSPGDK